MDIFLFLTHLWCSVFAFSRDKREAIEDSAFVLLGKHSSRTRGTYTEPWRCCWLLVGDNPVTRVCGRMIGRPLSRAAGMDVLLEDVSW